MSARSGAGRAAALVGAARHLAGRASAPRRTEAGRAADAQPAPDASTEGEAPIAGSDRIDGLVPSLLGLWMVAGLFLDGWAHDEQRPESFFTPWHGVLYSGFAAAATSALYQAWRRRRPGRRWREVLPRGHGLTLVALAVFAAGAAGDLLWHELLGIELGIEALLSPTHLLLMASGAVVLSAPLRSAWGDPCAEPTLRPFLPVALSAALVTALVAFFLSFFSPFANDVGGTAFDRFPGQQHSHPSSDPAELQQVLGVGSVLLLSVVLAIAAAGLLRRWRPPAGTFTLLFGLVILLLAAIDEFAQPSAAFAGVAAGIVGDVSARRRLPAVAVCAGAVTALWLAYFGSYAVEEGSVAWAAELWVGSVFLAGLLAAAVGLLVGPPATRRPG